MNKKYDVIVYIGRFQPVHNAHVETLKRAGELASKVVVIVGSANQPRTFKNPWTSMERESMIRSAVALGVDKLAVEHNVDTIYNDQAWVVRVQELVGKHTKPGDKVALIGYEKDDTSFYLKMFPQWGRIDVELIEPLNATNIRDLYFRKDANMNFINGVIPRNVARELEAWRATPEYEQIVRERDYIDNYKRQFAGLAYPPVFVTVDAILIQSGHVLMIKRRSEPGKGLWAVPGGFLNANTDKSVQAAMLRELREETGIKVPAPVLAGSIKDVRVFDAIDRSARGRTITHAFKIVLPDDAELPRVKGMDDAEKAKWIPIGEIRSDQCFEDHYEMITWAVGG